MKIKKIKNYWDMEIIGNRRKKYVFLEFFIFSLYECLKKSREKDGTSKLEHSYRKNKFDPLCGKGQLQRKFIDRH